MLLRSASRSLLTATRQPRTAILQRQVIATARNPAFLVASSSRLFSTTGRVGEDSHSDFQKQSKVPQQKQEQDANEATEVFDVQEWLGKVVKEHPVLLFMKGSPQNPRCGFSASVVTILKDHGCEFASADILENEDVRQGLKVFSNWPTFPQLYIDGEFIGGADIVTELGKQGELKTMLEKVGAIKEEK